MTDALNGDTRDPDELAIAEMARIVKTGKNPCLQFVIAADGTTSGFRVSPSDDWAHGKFFACAPQALSASMCRMVGDAMVRASGYRMPPPTQPMPGEHFMKCRHVRGDAMDGFKSAHILYIQMPTDVRAELP